MPINRKKIDEKLIRLSRFSEVGPYSAAYLSLLVQRKKLKAKKVGRNYFTSLAWFNEYLNNHANGEKVEFDQEKMMNLLNYAPSENIAVKPLDHSSKNTLPSHFFDIFKITTKQIYFLFSGLVLAGFIFFIFLTPGASARLLSFAENSADVMQEKISSVISYAGDYKKDLANSSFRKQASEENEIASNKINKVSDYFSSAGDDLGRRNKVLLKKVKIFTGKINSSLSNIVLNIQGSAKQVQIFSYVAINKTIGGINMAGNSLISAYHNLENSFIFTTQKAFASSAILAGEMEDGGEQFVKKIRVAVNGAQESISSSAENAGRGFKNAKKYFNNLGDETFALAGKTTDIFNQAFSTLSESVWHNSAIIKNQASKITNSFDNSFKKIPLAYAGIVKNIQKGKSALAEKIGFIERSVYASSSKIENSYDKIFSQAKNNISQLKKNISASGEKTLSTFRGGAENLNDRRTKIFKKTNTSFDSYRSSLMIFSGSIKNNLIDGGKKLSNFKKQVEVGFENSTDQISFKIEYLGKEVNNNIKNFKQIANSTKNDFYNAGKTFSQTVKKRNTALTQKVKNLFSSAVDSVLTIKNNSQHAGIQFKNNILQIKNNSTAKIKETGQAIAGLKLTTNKKIVVTVENFNNFLDSAGSITDKKLKEIKTKNKSFVRDVEKNYFVLADNVGVAMDLSASQVFATGDKLDAGVNAIRKEINKRNHIIARRLLSLGEKFSQTSLFVAGYFKEKYSQTKNIAYNTYNISKTGYHDFSILSRNAFLNEKKEFSQLFKNSFNQKQDKVALGEIKKENQGRVLGVEEREKNMAYPALEQARKIKIGINSVFSQTANSIAGVLENLSQKQNSLSISLGNKAADLSYEGAGKIKGVSESGSKKIALVGDVISETNQSVEDYGQKSKNTFNKELGRSLWSLGDIYIKVIDFFVPDSLKTHYATVYTPEKNIQVNQPFVNIEQKDTEQKVESKVPTNTTTIEKIIEVRTEKIIEKTVVEKIITNNQIINNETQNTNVSSPATGATTIPNDLALNNLLVKNNLEVQGEFKISSLKINNLQVSGELKVGNYLLPQSAGINGQVLKIGGDGKVYWAEDIIGGGGGGSVVSSGGGGTVTSVDMTVPTGLAISGNPITSAGTLALSLEAGYIIPLIASTTEWSDFYLTPSNRITAGTGLSWAGNTLNAAAQNINQLGQIGDVSTTTLAYGSMIRWNGSIWESVATSTLGLAGSGGTVTSVDMTVPTGLAISGNPITSFGTLSLAYADGYSIPLTASTTEGSTAYNWGNHALAGYITDGNTGWDNSYGLITLSNLSSSATGLAYNNTTGAFSWSIGYEGLTTASSTNWNTFYDTPSNRITAGDYIDWSSNTLNVTDSWYNAIGDLPTGAIANGDITHIANNDQVYDFVTGLGYLTTADISSNTNLAISAPGLELSNDTIVLSNGYVIASTTRANTWDSAYNWGNHALAGYITDGNTGWDNSYGLITLSNLSSSATGLAYNNTTGAFSWSIGYEGLTTASSTNWNTFYDTPSNRITAGTGLSWSSNTLNATNGALNYGSLGSMVYYPANGTTATGTNISNLVWDNTNNRLGIGDATPNSLLTVGNGDLFQVNSSGFALHPLGAVGTPSLSFVSDPNTGIYSSGADTLNFTTAGTESGRFTSTGKFGIGTTSPDSLLTVYSDGSQTGGLFHIATSSTEVLYASASGNIGIGVTYPNAKLEVMSASTQLKLSYNDSTYGTISTDSSGLLTLTGNSGVGGNVIIASSSRLALGTTTPDSLFYILQNGAMDVPLMRIASSTTTGLNNYLLVDSNGKLAVGSSFSSVLFNVGSSTPSHVSGYRDSFMSGALEIDDLLYVDGTGTSTIAGNLSVVNSLAADRLTIGGPNLIIESSGTITRGTWHGSDINISDYTNLSLNATGLALANSTISLDSNYSIPLLASTTNWNTFYSAPSSRIDAGTGLSWSGNTLNTTNGIINNGTAGSLAYYNTAGTTLSSTQDWQLFWDGTRGNLSIGTSTPSSKLSVWGDEGSLMTVFNVMDHASSTLFTILGNGSVGIGTTTPVALLDMVKTQNLPSVISVSNFNAGASSSAGIITNSDTASGGFLTYSSSFIVPSLANTSFLYSYNNASGGLMLDTEAAAPIRFATNGYANERMRISSDGKVGIGTSSPTYQLSVTKTSPAENEIIFGISTSTAGTIFTVDEDGDITYDGTASSPAADYAEYFFTNNLNLEAGETVCVDTTQKNAVRRCEDGADGNVMGIISTKPAIVGNRKQGFENNPSYAVVGMLGQVPAKVSAENGPIRPGDSLTSASSTPGYAMRANAGDSTVGVALEPLAEGKGKINVLISRRNKSLTVEEVEEKVTERVAAMEIEDEVNILIASAIDKLSLDDEVNENVNPKLLLLESKLTIQTDSITGRIASVEKSISDIAGILQFVQNDIVNMDSRLAVIENWKAEVATGTSSISQLSSLYIDNLGNVKIGRGAREAESYGDSSASSTAEIASVEVVSLSDTNQTAFVVNQEGAGDIADFKKDQVSIMNIDNDGHVTIVGNLFVSGKIMACSGSACGSALDLAVDETMGDIGVEGKVVAGAFEGYCEDGFIWVPGNNKYGTMPGFCVMSGQAKSNSNYTPPTPSQNGDLWVDVSQGEAQLACQSLGSDYHLLSENEWLTIANSIIKNSANDQDDSSEGLQLKTDSLSYPSEYILTNKNSIKEFGQGIGEWTDKIVTKSGCPKLASANDWNEYIDVLDYYGLEIAPAYYLTDKDNNIGLIRSEENTDNIRGFVRGLNGIYSLDLSYSPSIATSTVGFRCAK